MRAARVIPSIALAPSTLVAAAGVILTIDGALSIAMVAIRVIASVVAAEATGMVTFGVLVSIVNTDVSIVVTGGMIPGIHRATGVLIVVAAIVVVTIQRTPSAVVAAGAMIPTIETALIVMMIALGVITAIVVTVIMVAVIAQTEITGSVNDACDTSQAQASILVGEVNAGLILAVRNNHGRLVVQHAVRISELCVVAQRHNNDLVSSSGQAAEPIAAISRRILRGHNRPSAVLQLNCESSKCALSTRRSFTHAHIVAARGMIMTIV